MYFDNNGQLSLFNELFFRDSSATNSPLMLQITKASYTATSPYNTNKFNALSNSHIAFQSDGVDTLTILSGGLAKFTPIGEFAALFENTNTTGGQHCYVDIKSNGGSNGLSILRFITDVAESGGTSAIVGSQDDLLFQTGVGDAYSTRLSISSEGDVGIGTTSPNNKLDVNGGIVCSPNTDGKDTFELSTNASDEGRLRIKNVDTTTVQIRAGGNSYFNGGNVGIGVISPSNKLHVFGNIRSSASDTSKYTLLAPDGLYVQGAQNAYIFSPQDMFFYSGGVVRVAIADGQTTGHSTGALELRGAGTTLADGTTAFVNHYLDTGNNYEISIGFKDTSQDIVIINSSAGVRLDYAATSWVSNSDENVKENIVSLENVLDKIKDIRCVNYNLKDEDIYKKRLGFIAQDFQEDFEEVVSKNSEGILGLHYTETIPILTKAIQEQQTIIEDLKSRIEKLEL